MDSAVNSDSSTNISTAGSFFSSTRPTYDSRIPDIPASLMIPPLTASSVTTTASFASGSKGMVSSSSHGNPEIKELHQDLGSMHSHVVREAEALQNLHRKLSIKGHEMDRLKAEISQLERAESAVQLEPSNPLVSGPRMSSTINASNARGGLVNSSTGLQTAYSTSTANPMVEEFRTRLQMTTELCAKQDNYYRDIIKELEERLKETIQGRDHILSLRDKEAADQVNLMRQLENALRKQQQITASKSEDIVTIEEKLKQVQGSHSSLLSVFDKISQVLINQEKRRGRHCFLENQELPGKEFTSHMSDALVQTLQKCLFEDASEKEQLTSKLEKTSGDLKDLENEMKQKIQETRTDCEIKLENLKKDHKEALQSATSQYTKTTERLHAVEQQLELTNKQHAVEVSGLMDKANALQKELDNVSKQKNEIVNEFEKKTSDLDLTNHGIAVELKLLREEKEKLLSNYSQEQANTITLKKKLMDTEEDLKSSKERITLLTNENDMKELNLKKEVENYRLEAEKYKTQLLEKERGLCLETEKEVQNAVRNEQSKAEERINIVLYELKKVNNENLTFKSKYEALETELNELKVEQKVVKDNLEKTERDLANEKEDKLKTLSKLDNEVKETDRLHKELDSKVKDLEEKREELDAANITIEKTKTQLEEREKTIASFREHDNYFAEILQRNTQAGDSLQKEREELVRKVQEQAADVHEMKKHREILAKKLKAKDKRLKEIEEENAKLQKSFAAKNEELAAIMDDRKEIVSELKTRQLEVGNLRQERDSLSNLLDGKDGEREKEIGKLLSRLKGSEQDLCLTKKLLKSKGDVSGKAVRVAESMQREVTEKRGEMDALLNKIHWLQENLNAAVKDKMYFESKSTKLSDELHDAVILRDKFQFELKQSNDECNAYQKQVSHLEQALEKAALKYADSQSMIEKLEQDCARLKLKHSLELKDYEKNIKSSTIKLDSQTIAEVLGRISAMNTRLPLVTSQAVFPNTSITQKTPVMAQPITLRSLKPIPQGTQHSKTLQSSKQDAKNEDVHQDLKSLLLDVRTLISTFQSHVSSTPAKHHGPQNDYRDVKSNKPVPENEGHCDDALEHLEDTELNISFDMNDGHHGNIRAPLRSSSPKPDREVSMTTSRDPSPSNSDSDVTSLLSFSTAVSLNVPSEGNYSVASSNRYKAPKTSETKRKPFSQVVSLDVPSEENYSVVSSNRYKAPKTVDTKRKPLVNKNDGTQVSRTKTKKRTSKHGISKSPPSYEKAEEMLRSLAQTGTRLSKKNKEISRLLSEQDRRIQQCRENEFGLSSLLH